MPGYREHIMFTLC